MPLIVVCGRPCVGKSTFSLKLAEYLADNDVKNVHVVTADQTRDATSNKKTSFSSAAAEKMSRGQLKSAIDRLLTKDSTVICDGANYIKGYRYELYCAARAVGTYLVCVWVGSTIPLSSALAINMERGDGHDAYDPRMLRDLWLRFEPPDARNKWECPLVIADFDGYNGESSWWDVYTPKGVSLLEELDEAAEKAAQTISDWTARGAAEVSAFGGGPFLTSKFDLGTVKATSERGTESRKALNEGQHNPANKPKKYPPGFQHDPDVANLRDLDYYMGDNLVEDWEFDLDKEAELVFELEKLDSALEDAAGNPSLVQVNTGEVLPPAKEEVASSFPEAKKTKSAFKRSGKGKEGDAGVPSTKSLDISTTLSPAPGIETVLASLDVMEGEGALKGPLIIENAKNPYEEVLREMKETVRKGVLPQNVANVQAPVYSSNFMHQLDLATSDVLTSLLEKATTKDNTCLPGTYWVSHETGDVQAVAPEVAANHSRLDIPRPVVSNELRKLKHTFERMITESHSSSETMREFRLSITGASADNIEKLVRKRFVEYMDTILPVNF